MRWGYSSSKLPNLKVPEFTKIEVTKAAETLIETVLKPQYIKPPLKNAQFNYIVDIDTKWYRSYFYFCAKYACPVPNAVLPPFENRFARMKYVGDNRFHLSFMRPTNECLEAIIDESYFQP